MSSTRAPLYWQGQQVEAGAVDVLVDQVGPSCDLTHPVNRHDARVRQPGDGARFDQKPLPRRLGRAVGGDELDGYWPLEQRVFTEPYLTHPTLAELVVEAVSIKFTRNFADKLSSHAIPYWSSRPRSVMP